ncbi:LacI family DNA-binding transcriptional regulator [Agreia sp. COWG]|uniref:LacI family DNA-binding transcriptional regulator n=1 Tax=Agreia sp. COWG TaxID=2773266 RepID=UPI00192744F0|nr:LacI family DNA-binding transcriptional regulator [Agreia sp. COWG]
MANNRGASTIVDVAALAGVSRQTVTRALNDMVDVSASTKARVLAAADELNYRPNRHAQSMVQGRTTTIGLVLDDLSNPYFAELASALSRVAAERQWSVLLCDIGTDREKGRAQLASIVSRVDALALTGCRSDTLELLPASVLRQSTMGLPLLMLDGPDHERLDARIVLDVASGMTAALDHLVATGRRRIAFVDSDAGSPERRDIYDSYLEERGLDWGGRPHISADETVDGGMSAAERLMREAPDCDAVLVYNDVMAIGVLKTMRRLGYPVPQQVAVIGMDGLEVGRLVTPELTTLAIDKGAIAQASVALLEQVLTAGRPAMREVVIGLTLLVRESS